MSTKAKRHVHKYYRIPLVDTKVWGCALPTCNHYMPKHLEALVEGKASICWSCGETFILDSTNMKSDKPICIDCALPGLNEVTLQSDEISAQTISHNALERAQATLRQLQVEQGLVPESNSVQSNKPNEVQLSEVKQEINYRELTREQINNLTEAERNARPLCSSCGQLQMVIGQKDGLCLKCIMAAMSNAS